MSSPKRPHRSPGIHLEGDLHERLRQSKRQTGVPLVVQVNMLVRAWLDARPTPPSSS
jgi:hypothetical protein